jgi:hypothetical protein
MNIKEARDAIEAILAAIPDDELPDFDKVEIDDGRVLVWWGDCGHVLGSAKAGGERDPLSYRRNGSWGAIESEMTYRADRRLLDNGDDPTGLRLASKTAVI